MQSKKLSQQKGHNDDPVEMKTMLRHTAIHPNTLLYRKVQFHSCDQPSLQYLLPQNYRQQAMKACHDDIGHLGLERALDLPKDRFYWAGMSTNIENHIQTCDRCLCFKSKPQKTELYPITSIHLLESVHMYFCTVELGKTGKDISKLVITDHFTQYAQAFVTSSQTARVVAQTLWDKFFMHSGLPEKILSVQGCNFESRLIAEQCEISKVKKLCTTPYRPQCNGQYECFNATLMSVIGTLPTEAKINWQEQLPILVHAYNCSHLNVTGFSHFYLMLGRQSMLPINMQFGVLTPDIVASTSHSYIQKLQRRLE